MKQLICILSIFLSPLLYAGNTFTSSALEIRKVYFYSNQESIYPEHKGSLQVFFEKEIIWSKNGHCGTESVVIRKEDSHIISAILAARMSSTPIHLYADDSLKLSEQCYLRAIGM